jgi:heme exporter protein A
MLCGLLPPTSGEIRWQGVNIGALGEEYFSAVTYIGHREAVKDELTATENIRVCGGLYGFEMTRNQSVAVLERIGLAGQAQLHARLLSEGQRRRLALARLMVRRSPLWLLDEIVTSLDAAAAQSVRSLIDEHLSNGGMAIIATHQDIGLSGGLCRRIELAS